MAIPATELTKKEALRQLLARFEIRADLTERDYDPAGSTCLYIPNQKDVRIAEVLMDRSLVEEDLNFWVGSEYCPPRYTIPAKILNECLGEPENSPILVI